MLVLWGTVYIPVERMKVWGGHFPQAFKLEVLIYMSANSSVCRAAVLSPTQCEGLHGGLGYATAKAACLRGGPRPFKRCFFQLVHGAIRSLCARMACPAPALPTHPVECMCGRPTIVIVGKPEARENQPDWGAFR